VSEPTVLVVDAANVVGSRPDGWWRDRAGAARRLLQALDGLRDRTVPGPDGAPLHLGRVVAVLEGKARAAEGPPGVEVVRAVADGDSSIVQTARRLLAEGQRPLVVTADRGLRQRLPEGVDVAGPGWLNDLIGR
jgi:hypothetical protein